jgi:putative ABC transport system permease protein
MDEILHDLRHAARSLVRRPGFSTTVVLTLALGIGATTAIFSVVYALLLRRLPFPHAERLVTVSETVRRDVVERRAFSYPDFTDLEREATSFSALAAWNDATWALVSDGKAERVKGEVVSPGYFPLLGVEPLLGRGLAAPAGEEGRSEVVLGYGLWQRRFAGDRGVLGARVRLDDGDFTVVGVLPPGFSGLSGKGELWTSIADLPAGLLGERGSRWHAVVGRLAPGVSRARAAEEVAGIFRHLEGAHPEANQGYGGIVIPLRDDLFGDLERPLTLLFAAVALVLLIACANVAHLLLVRVAGRRRERAVRVALGAGRARLLAQHLAETLVLSLAGAAAGIGVAVAGIHLLAAVNPVDLPAFVPIRLDGGVLLFTVALALATALGLGLATSLRTGARTAADLATGIRGGSPGPAARRARGLLVVVEVALALVLAVGGALTALAFRNLRGIDPGFDPAALLVFRVNLAASGLDGPQRLATARRLSAAVGARPGVAAVAIATDAPFEGTSAATLVTPEGRQLAPDAPYGGATRVYRHLVSPGYFAALRAPLSRGRDFTAEDREEAPRTAIVSQALARRLWPGGEDPVGQRFKFGPPSAKDSWVTVVAVAADLKQRALVADATRTPTDPDLYLPLFASAPDNFAFLVRARGSAAALVPGLRAEVARAAPAAAAYRFESMGQRLDQETASSRFSSLLMGAFALLAVVLATLGLYGVMAYSVAERTREIGIRMALGARGERVLGMVVGQGMALVAGGVAVGLGASLVLGRLVDRLLYGVSASEPAVLAAATLLLAAVALGACLLPARRASRVDPLVALRHE